MALSKMDRHLVKQYHEQGMSVPDLAVAFEVSEKTITRTLRGETGAKQDQVADRMEALLGGSTIDSGCYRTVNGKREALTDQPDQTFEEVAFEEDMENIIIFEDAMEAFEKCKRKYPNALKQLKDK